MHESRRSTSGAGAPLRLEVSAPALRGSDSTWTLLPPARAARLGRPVHRDTRPSHFEE